MGGNGYPKGADVRKRSTSIKGGVSRTKSLRSAYCHEYHEDTMGFRAWGLTPFRAGGTITHHTSSTLVPKVICSSPPCRQIASEKASLSPNDEVVWATFTSCGHTNPHGGGWKVSLPIHVMGVISHSTRRRGISTAVSVAKEHPCWQASSDDQWPDHFPHAARQTPQLPMVQDGFHR